MNLETLFKSFLALISIISAQGQGWLEVGSYTAASFSNYYTFSVILVAGRQYNIAAVGYDTAFNTTMNVSDPSGYWAFNDDWGGSNYPLSSALNFTPTTSGVTVIRIDGTGPGSGSYIYVNDITPCLPNCTGKCFRFL